MIRILEKRRATVLMAGGAVLAMAAAAPGVRADEPAPAPQAEAAVTQDIDPLEPLNRTVSSFNRVVRGLLLDPMVEAYKGLVPPPVQKTVSNVTGNIAEPITAISSAIQGDSENAGKAMERFVINSTVGLGGTRDVATEQGVTARKEDLGQALGANGMASGPHIVLPLIGPSNMRDALGDVVTAVASPIPLAGAVDNAVSYAEKKDDIQAATKGALDPYVVERDGYEQHRVYQVTNGAPPIGDMPTVAGTD